MTTSLESPITVQAGKYLTVVLADESYGIAVMKVCEIIRLQKITPVPQIPEFVKGVINLRGCVIPIVDLRVKFGLEAQYAERTCIVVVQVELASGSAIQMGLIVDSVEEVVNFSTEKISPSSEFGMSVNPEYLLGMAKVQRRVKALLDIDRAITAENLQALFSAT